MNSMKFNKIFLSKIDSDKFDFDAEKVSVDDAEKAITALGYEVKKSQVKD